MAADVTTLSRAILPEDAKRYWKGQVHPAKFVRASMSIPFFFFPKEVENIPGKGKDATRPVWGTYNGKIPEKAS